jgi:hypothetical protein
MPAAGGIPAHLFAPTCLLIGRDHTHFCLTGQYSPQALNHIMDNPTVSRYEAAKQSIEAAGGKLISMYSTAANGPGILVIFDMPLHPHSLVLWWPRVPFKMLS